MAIVRHPVLGAAFLRLAWLSIASLFAIPAYASVVATTYGSGYTFTGVSRGNLTGYPPRPAEPYQVLAAEFYVTAETHFTGARLGLSGSAPAAPYIIAIAADSGAKPNRVPTAALLESIAGKFDANCCETSIHNSQWTGPGLTVTASGSLILHAKTHYWLELIVPGSAKIAWNDAISGISANGDVASAAGVYNSATHSAGSLKAITDTGIATFAFEIDGKRVPFYYSIWVLMVCLVLLVLLLAAIIVTAKRRRRARRPV